MMGKIPTSFKFSTSCRYFKAFLLNHFARIIHEFKVVKWLLCLPPIRIVLKMVGSSMKNTITSFPTRNTENMYKALVKCWSKR